MGRVEPSITYARVRERGGGRGEMFRFVKNPRGGAILRQVQQLEPNYEQGTSTRHAGRPADFRITELIPGLQEIRQKTLPQMYFEDCSVFRGTYE